MERTRPTSDQVLRTARKVSSAQDMPKEHEYEEKPLRVPSFKADVFGVVMLAFAGGFGVGLAVTGTWVLAVGFGSVIALFFLLWRTWKIFDEPVSHIRETTWQQAWVDYESEYSPTLVQIPGNNGTVIEFRQPQPGEFANWLGEILASHTSPSLRDRVTFSQNTARARGWPAEMYRGMLSALRLAGWVHRKGQYWIPTNTGERYLSAWLRQRQHNENR